MKQEMYDQSMQTILKNKQHISFMNNLNKSVYNIVAVIVDSTADQEFKRKRENKTVQVNVTASQIIY